MIALTLDIFSNKSRYPTLWVVLALAKMRWVVLETSLETHLKSPRTSPSRWSELVDSSAHWVPTRLHEPSVILVIVG